jgi:ribosomal protein L11 methyltransferase
MAAWIELRLVVPRDQVSQLAHLAVAAGASGVQEAPPPGESPQLQQPWDPVAPIPTSTCTLKTWVSPKRAEDLQAQLSAAAGVPVEMHPADEEIWEEDWKRYHQTVQVGPLRISPPWLATDGDLVIPPGQAFGTGDHATTQSCLAALVELAPTCKTVLDVGCGSGVLTLAAMRLGLRAQGIDIDPLAVATSIENALINSLSANFSDEPLSGIAGPFDVIVANLYAEILVDLAPELVRLTGEWLVLAGVLWDRYAMVLRAMKPLIPAQVVRDGDWAHMRLRRP